MRVRFWPESEPAFSEMNMHVSFRHTASIFLLAGLVAGCANLGAGSKQPGVKADADRAKAPELSKQRLMLSEGYSMLYKDASNLDLAELILYVKVESEAVIRSSLPLLRLAAN